MRYWCTRGRSAVSLVSAQAPFAYIPATCVHQWCSHRRRSVADTNKIEQIYPGAYAIKKTIDDPYQAVTPQGKVLFNFPLDVTYIQPASDGLILCTASGVPQPGGASAHEKRLSYLDHSGNPVLTVQGLRALPMKFGFACVAKFRAGHPVQWEVIDRRGAVIQPPQDAYFAPLCKDRIAKFKQSDRFDPVYWKVALYRYDEFAKFLRNYDLIGMSRDEVIALLGHPQANGLYSLESGTCGNTWSGLSIEYENDRVKGWREVGRSGGNDYSGTWVTTNMIYDNANEEIGRVGSKPYITTLYAKPAGDPAQRSLNDN